MYIGKYHKPNNKERDDIVEYLWRNYG